MLNTVRAVVREGKMNYWNLWTSLKAPRSS
jgi:hypothetical protein